MECVLHCVEGSVVGGRMEGGSEGVGSEGGGEGCHILAFSATSFL